MRFTGIESTSLVRGLVFRNLHYLPLHLLRYLDIVKGPVLRKADKIPYGDFATVPLGPRMLPRATLLNILHKDLKNANCHVQTNKKIMTWEQQDQRELVLYFEDGTSAVVDLLIGADGVHSQVRRRLFEGQPMFSEPEFSGQVAYRMSAPKAEIVKLKPNHEALRGFKIVGRILS